MQGVVEVEGGGGPYVGDGFIWWEGGADTISVTQLYMSFVHLTDFKKQRAWT